MNEECLKREIMGQNRHQFIYGYNNGKRKKFLSELSIEFPIMIDCNIPMCIYLREFGLPKISNDDVDKNKLISLSREYLSFAIAYEILLKSKSNVDNALLNVRIKNLIKFFCYDNIKNNMDGLIDAFLESKEFYMSYYLEYLNNGYLDKSINDIAVPFLDLEWFISQYKKELNNQAYFCILLDKIFDISSSSIMAVNDLIGSRNNGNISMKVVVEPGKWDSYALSNGQYIESIHDYDSIELDDSGKKYIKKLII